MSLFELLVPSVCPACDRRRGAGELLLCPACAPGLRTLSELGQVATAVAYERTGLILVRRFKFEDRRDALRVLLELLTARAQPSSRPCPDGSRTPRAIAPSASQRPT